MKKGKEPMRTFGDLMQFFVTKTDDKKPPVQNKKEQGEKSSPTAIDVSAAKAMTESAAKVNMPIVVENLESPPFATPVSPEPAESGSPIQGELSSEPQTPPADEGQ